MRLFRIERKSRRLSDMAETDAYAEGVLETKDLENWIASRSHQELFRRPILWICKQDRPTDSDRSDLLGIDNEARLVLLELKRGTVGIDALTQALRYLPDYSRKRRVELVQMLAQNVNRPAASKLPDADFSSDDAAQKIDDVTQGATEINESQVLQLLGADFEPETLSGCDYLNRACGEGRVLRVECWQYHLFKDEGGLFLSVTQLIPQPDLQQEIQEKRDDRRAGKFKRNPVKMEFMRRFKETLRNAGYECWGKRGRSYSCFLRIGKGGDLEFGIYGNPYLTVRKDAGYKTFNLNKGNWREEEDCCWYDFGEVD